MLILAIIVFGMVAGWLAQLLLGQSSRRMDWGMALVAGLVGSFVGGLLVSLLAGDGLGLHPTGIIGAAAGAVIVTAIWQSARTGSFSWRPLTTANRRAPAAENQRSIRTWTHAHQGLRHSPPARPSKSMEVGR